MSFLKNFFTLLFITLLILIGTIFFWVEGTLQVSAHTLREKMRTVKRLAERPKFHEGCFEGLAEEGGEVEAYTLRFLNEKEFVVEAECRLSSEIVELDRGKLQWGVRKVRGSGVRWPVNSAEVEAVVVLEQLFRTVAVGVDRGEVGSVDMLVSSFDEGESHNATTSCQGWGGVCCMELNEVGVGTAYERVNDCKGNCFSACISRPVVSVFAADPGWNMQERKLRVRSDQPVTFSFRVDDFDGEVRGVSVDFGDGEIVKGLSGLDEVKHTYSCFKPSCEYTARILAEDSEGLVLAKSHLNEMKVIVTSSELTESPNSLDTEVR